MKMRVGSMMLLICLLLTGCSSAGNTTVQTQDTLQVAEGTEPTKAPMVAQDAEPEQTSEAVETPVSPTDPIELKIYSQLCSYWGEQQGWFAQVLLDKFHVKFNYIMESDVEKDPEKVADIIVFGSKNQYLEAVKEGLLLDWEKDGLLAEHGPYILENMPVALEYNRSLTPEKNRVFGFGTGAVPDMEVCEDFFLTWDIRWDLYKELNYPEVTDLEDLTSLLADMKEICSANEEGEEVYAMSLWSDWDNGMLMTAKCLATAYYGYDEHHLGLYDTETGTFHGALEEEGPYLEMLCFLNSMYRKGLLDPDSATQSYDDMMAKMTDDRILFSLFDYAGSKSYNTQEHLAENKYMASMVPEKATPAAYGLSVFGSSHRIWTIGANTEHAELVMEIMNWLCTPEGRLTCEYGPKGVTWDYDEDGGTYLTELGKTCMEERTTLLTGEYEWHFNDGCPQINAITWNYRAPNPDADGENYDYRSWKSNVPEASCEVEQDWREFTDEVAANEYIKKHGYVVIPEVYYEATEKSSELQEVWKQVAECIEKGSWDAVYAKSEDEFEDIIERMQAEAMEQGYEKCMAWCEYETMRREKLENEVRAYFE